MQYQKPHASFSEQVKRLQERGLIINDERRAEHYLSIVGYYRLSSYCYRFELPPANGIRTHKFRDGTTFDDIVRIYVFDQKLRALMLEALERFEVAVRSVLAHAMSESYGPHAHMNAELFGDRDEYFKSFVNLMEETKRAQANSEEIAHYLKHYDAPFLPPIWIITSVMSFRELFRWVKNTKSTPVKLQVAKAVGLPNIQVLEGVSRALTTVRNLCAHHGRLWDRRLSTKLPYLTKNLRVPLKATVDRSGGNEADPRMFNCIVVLAHLMLFLNKSSTWPFRVASLVKDTLSEEEQGIMGFPDNWDTNPFWSTNSEKPL